MAFEARFLLSWFALEISIDAKALTLALIFICDAVCGAYVIALGELLEIPSAVVSVCPRKTAASYSLVWVTDIFGYGFNTVGALPQHLPLPLIAF